MRFAVITGKQVDIAFDRLMFSPWMYKIGLGTWSNSGKQPTIRTRVCLTIIVGLN